MLENRDILVVTIGGKPVVRPGKACGHNTGMYAAEKSDIGITGKRQSAIWIYFNREGPVDKDSREQGSCAPGSCTDKTQQNPVKLDKISNTWHK